MPKWLLKDNLKVIYNPLDASCFFRFLVLLVVFWCFQWLFGAFSGFLVLLVAFRGFLVLLVFFLALLVAFAYFSRFSSHVKASTHGQVERTEAKNCILFLKCNFWEG